VSWLFESGAGASRQLRRYRQVRQPDLVFAGFLGAVGAGLALTRRAGPAPALALPALYLGAASAAHVNTRFVARRGGLGRFAGAVVADGALLLSYFGGRVAGHVPVPAMSLMRRT
jgi:hypothetical protein